MNINLMYHNVTSNLFPYSGFSDIAACQYNIDIATFEKQIVVASQYNNVVFTFDDGGSSFYTIIADILERYGKKGIFFISTAYIGKNGFLTPSQITDLNKRGHIIASHSHTHPEWMSKLSAEESLKEWKTSKQILESIIQEPVLLASVPNGDVSKMVIRNLVKAGYSDIYTSEPTIHNRKFTRSVTIHGRFAITNTMNTQMVTAIITNPCVRTRLFIRYQLLSIIKFILGDKYEHIKQEILESHLYNYLTI